MTEQKDPRTNHGAALLMIADQNRRIADLEEINRELKQDAEALKTVIFLDYQTPENFAKFHAARITYTGAAAEQNQKDSYIATYLCNLLRAAEALGWRYVHMEFKGGRWHFHKPSEAEALAAWNETPLRVELKDTELLLKLARQERDRMYGLLLRADAYYTEHRNGSPNALYSFLDSWIKGVRVAIQSH